MALLEDLQRVRELLRSEPGVECAYLFGSAARPSPARPAKDLDVAVVFSPSSARPDRQALDLHARLERHLEMRLDLFAFEALPLDLQFRAISEGQVLVDRDPLARNTREARVMTLYYDFQPYLDRILDASMQRLARVPADRDDPGAKDHRLGRP